MRRVVQIAGALLLGAFHSQEILAQSSAGRPDSEPAPIQAGLAPPPGRYAPGLDAQHYAFEISLMEDADWFAGRAEITLRLVDPIPDELALDLSGLAVDVVLVEGSAVEFTLRDGKILFPAPTGASGGEDILVTVQYRGVPEDGLFLGQTRHGTPSVFADNWPNRARFWIPTVDHPSDKATARFTVHAPRTWQVIAPGRLVGSPAPTATDALGGSEDRLTWVWDIGVPVSPYNLVIGATEFTVHALGTAACTNAPVTPRDDKCIEVTSWAFPPDADTAMAKFRRAPDMVDHFTWTIGLYPFEKLANVQSATRFGGMENASAIFYSETGVAGSSDDGVVSHEIAHQWFGDAVTEAEWSHLWLSEGFATYFGAQYFENAVSVEDFRRRLEENRLTYVQSDDVNNPIVRREESLFSLLNRNNYQKGGWVLHMLRYQVGEVDFAEMIHQYFSRFRGQTVLTQDLQQVAEEVSGQDLDWFFQQWVYQPGYPQIEFSYEWDDVTHEVVVTVEQTQPDSWPTFRFSGVVELVHDRGAARRAIEVRERDQTFRMPFVMEPVSVTFDPDGWLLKTLDKTPGR
jgi:aminopeptidase N